MLFFLFFFLCFWVFEKEYSRCLKFEVTWNGYKFQETITELQVRLMFGTVLFFVFYFLVQGKKKTKDLKFVTFIYVVISSIFFIK